MSHHPTGWTIERTIPSELAAGQKVLDELLVKLRAEDWSSRDMFGLHLALEEAIVNAIKHGNCLDANKQVQVVCRSTAEGVWIEISDQGRGFKPETVPDCTDADHIGCPNGRGIMLMRNYMTRVEYNPRGNVVTMEKLRGTSS